MNNVNTVPAIIWNTKIQTIFGHIDQDKVLIYQFEEGLVGFERFVHFAVAPFPQLRYILKDIDLENDDLAVYFLTSVQEKESIKKNYIKVHVQAPIILQHSSYQGMQLVMMDSELNKPHIIDHNKIISLEQFKNLHS